MSTGKIEIWITLEGDPCRINEQPPHVAGPWLVAVWDCSGRILEWCGRRFFALPADCGHLEIEVPPGRYILRAAEGMWWAPRIPGNHWTDHGVVTVGCGQTVCVTLFAPSAHGCGFGWIHVLEGLRASQMIPGDLAEDAIKANRAVIERVARSNFDIATQDTLVQLLRKAEEIKAGPPPKEDPKKTD